VEVVTHRSRIRLRQRPVKNNGLRKLTSEKVVSKRAVRRVRVMPSSQRHLIDAHDRTRNSVSRALRLTVDMQGPAEGPGRRAPENEIQTRCEVVASRCIERDRSGEAAHTTRGSDDEHGGIRQRHPEAPTPEEII